MFGESRYAGIVESEEEYRMDSTASLDHILPTYHQPHPWHRDAPFDRDFILVCEFCELEGPKPLMTVPPHAGMGSFGVDEFVVNTMAVDQTSNSDFALAEDTPVMTSDFHLGAFSYAHHFTLFDVQARGFVRPFCMVYVTNDQLKLTKFHDEMIQEFTNVSWLFKRNNLDVFTGDLENHLTDLEYTREKTMEYHQLAAGGGGMSGFSPAELSILMNQSGATLKDTYNEVRDVYLKLAPGRNTSSTKWASASSNGSWIWVKGSSFDFSEDGPFKGCSVCDHNGVSYPDSARDSFRFHEYADYKPSLVDLGGRKFEKRLRSIHELCGGSARKAILRLHCIHKYFSRDLMILEIDKHESRLLEPQSSLLTVGQCAQVNFLHNIQLSSHEERVSEERLQSNNDPTCALCHSQSPCSYAGTPDGDSAFPALETFNKMPLLSSAPHRWSEERRHCESTEEDKPKIYAAMPHKHFCFYSKDFVGKRDISDKINVPKGDRCDKNVRHDENGINRNFVTDCRETQPKVFPEHTVQGFHSLCATCQEKMNSETGFNGMVINPSRYIKRISLGGTKIPELNAKAKMQNYNDANVVLDTLSSSIDSGKDTPDNYFFQSNDCSVSLSKSASVNSADDADIDEDDAVGSRSTVTDEQDRLKNVDSSTSYETAGQSDECHSDENETAFYDANCGENCVFSCSHSLEQRSKFSEKCCFHGPKSLEDCALKINERVTDDDDLCSLCKRDRYNHNWPSSQSPYQDDNTGQGVVSMLNKFTHIEHVITSLLIGRPVIVIGNVQSEQLIQDTLCTLHLFLPQMCGCGGLPWEMRTKPLRIGNLVNSKLVGVRKPELKCTQSMISRSIQRYVTVLDIDNRVIISPQYRSAIVNSLLKNRKNFSTDSAFITHFHSVMSQMGRKAFVLYHSHAATTAKVDDGTDRCEVKCGTYRETISMIMKNLTANQMDGKILLSLVETMKLQQIEDHLKNTSRHTEIPVPFTRLEMENCQVFKCCQK